VDPDELRRRVDEVAWFHSIDLGGGIVTPGVGDSPRALERMGLPADLSGRTVLDVGAWDGFYSFEAERRGARRVVAADHFAWHATAGRWTGRAGFDLARDALGSQVEDVDIDVAELDPERVGVFDVVLFLGVLYHLRNPLLALERVASVTGGMLVLETAVDLAFIRRPAMAFYPGLELNCDHTNWWGPNASAVVAMLRSVGFAEVEVVARESARWRAEAFVRALAGRHRPIVAAQRGRLTVHAMR
jgi:tRNA (mo5U34)-methyltransferase